MQSTNKTARKIIFKFDQINGFSAEVEEIEVLDDSKLDKCPLITIKEQHFFDNTGFGINVVLGEMECIFKKEEVVEYKFRYYTITDSDDERLRIQNIAKEIIAQDLIKLEKLCFLCNINK